MSHATESGVVAAKGAAQVARLLAVLADNPTVPAAVREMLALLGEQIGDIDGQIADLDRKLAAQHKANPVSGVLAEVLGIEPIGALTLALRVDPDQFKSGRHFAIWLGLTPRGHSTGSNRSIIFTLRDLRQASPFLSEPPVAVMPMVQVMFDYLERVAGTRPPLAGHGPARWRFGEHGCQALVRWGQCGGISQGRRIHGVAEQVRCHCPFSNNRNGCGAAVPNRLRKAKCVA